jgi:hypothetical protein
MKKDELRAGTRDMIIYTPIKVVGKHEGKGSLGKPRCRCEENI